MPTYFSHSATDGAYTTVQNFTIQIGDVNDNTPMFVQPFNIVVNENHQIGIVYYLDNKTCTY